MLTFNNAYGWLYMSRLTKVLFMYQQNIMQIEIMRLNRHFAYAVFVSKSLRSSRKTCVHNSFEQTKLLENDL